MSVVFSPRLHGLGSLPGLHSHLLFCAAVAPAGAAKQATAASAARMISPVIGRRLRKLRSGVIRLLPI